MTETFKNEIIIAINITNKEVKYFTLINLKIYLSLIERETSDILVYTFEKY